MIPRDQIPEAVHKDLERRVLAGARKLDSELPGWERKIDLSQLELRDCQLCVLGQLFNTKAEESGYASGYTYGLDTLMIELAASDEENEFGAITCESEQLAFESMGYNLENGYIMNSEEYDLLNEKWTQFIKDRFDNGLLSDER